MTAWYDLLRLQSGGLDTGAIKNLDRRHSEHCDGSAGRTISLDPPVSRAYFEEYETFSKARKREAQVKRWTRTKKEGLVAGDKQ